MAAWMRGDLQHLRDMPDAPAIFVSVEVCEIIGHT
jgi:hypothetical protein